MTVHFRKASELPPDQAPRRGPGRPPGGGTPRKAGGKNLRKQIDGMVVALNAVVAQFRPADQLDGVEIATLVKAIDEQAKVNARFRRGLEAIFTVTSGTALLPVIMIIAARRLSRHRIIPPAVDPLGSVVLQMMQAEPSEAATAMGEVMDMFRNVSDGAKASGTNGDGSTAAS